MFCTPATDIEILKIVNKFKTNKSPGPDNIGTQLLKEVISSIIQPLLHIFNMSFTSGVVPTSLKIAKVIPVYKKGTDVSLEIIDQYPY